MLERGCTPGSLSLVNHGHMVVPMMNVMVMVDVAVMTLDHDGFSVGAGGERGEAN